MSSLKDRKEEFVSGLSGGTIGEIYAVTSVAFVSYLLYTLIVKHTKGLVERNLTDYLIDYMLSSFTLLLSITVYASIPGQLNILIILPIIVYIISHKTKHTEKQYSSKSKDDIGNLLPKKSFITAYRSQMMIITVIAIIAVDFPVFPRRFAKVETWGTSLMDLGVGSFVFSMGLVNSRSIIKQKFNSSVAARKFTLFQKITSSLKNYFLAILRSTKSSLPLLVIGIIRFISVKGLEYQEHVTEYGVHWNFFFTLGFLPIFLSILNPLLNYFPRALIGLGIGVVYELLLTQTDLLKFILSAPRVDIISSNKEGIWSFVGYLSIFICGQSLGSFVLTGFKTPGNLFKESTQLQYSNYKKPSANNKKLKWIDYITVSDTQGLIISTIFYAAFSYYLTTSYKYAVSRRIANLPYIIWVVSYNCFSLFIFKIIDSISGRKTYNVSHIVDAINNNGLLIFLLGNLLTGLINMTINTLDCGDYTAVGILTLYSVSLCGVAVVLDNLKIYVKL